MGGPRFNIYETADEAFRQAIEVLSERRAQIDAELRRLGENRRQLSVHQHREFLRARDASTESV